MLRRAAIIIAMNVQQALQLLKQVSTPAPPGCSWLSWTVLGDELVRPIHGFADDDGHVWLDAAIVGLFELNNTTLQDERVKLICDAEELACRRIVNTCVMDALSPSSARPRG
jgi:hypothetical protein